MSSGLPISILPASSDRPRCAPGQRAEYPAYRQRPVVVECRVLANPGTGLVFSWSFNATEPDFEQEVRLGQLPGQAPPDIISNSGSQSIVMSGNLLIVRIR